MRGMMSDAKPITNRENCDRVSHSLWDTTITATPTQVLQTSFCQSEFTARFCPATTQERPTNATTTKWRIWKVRDDECEKNPKQTRSKIPSLQALASWLYPASPWCLVVLDHLPSVECCLVAEILLIIFLQLLPSHSSNVGTAHLRHNLNSLMNVPWTLHCQIPMLATHLHHYWIVVRRISFKDFMTNIPSNNKPIEFSLLNRFFKRPLRKHLIRK